MMLRSHEMGWGVAHAGADVARLWRHKHKLCSAVLCIVAHAAAQIYCARHHASQNYNACHHSPQARQDAPQLSCIICTVHKTCEMTNDLCHKRVTLCHG